MRPLSSASNPSSRFACCLLIVLACTSSMRAQAPLTAGEAWQRIQHRYAAAPANNTVDTLKAGDPNTPVTGIATTFLDTMDVLREAARRGDNLVITHEPTFYNHADDTKAFEHDPVYLQKLDFIQQHHMIVYRLHDKIHFNSSGEDHILEGLYTALGWQALPHPPGPFGPYLAIIPASTLGGLVQTLKQRLGTQTMRIVGDPALPVTHVALLPGSAGLAEQVLALNQPQVNVLIAGEASEWETVEYVRDAAAQGRPKALILLGHEVSEEPGMEQCADDLRPLFPSLHVDHIPAGQALWSPDHPPAPSSAPGHHPLQAVAP